MKSITKKYYIENILAESDVFISTPGSIVEISLGRDYAYSIDKSSSCYKVNKSITSLVFDKIPLNNCAIGFRKGFSYYDFLLPHRNGYNFLRLDVKSYFHSLRFSTIKACLESYFENTTVDKEHPIKIVDSVLNFCTYTIPEGAKNEKFVGKRVLPMGFPSSPSISNIIFRQVDIEIQKLCHSLDITYSRYADDLLFSTLQSNESIHSNEFENSISSLLGKLSLSINSRKTLRKKHTISLNGNVIEYGKKGGNIRLSNKKIGLVNKMTHLALIRKESPRSIVGKLFNISFEKHKFKIRRDHVFFDKYCKDQLCNKVVGYRSYILSIIQFHRKHPCLDHQYYVKYSKIVDRLDKMIRLYQ